MGLIVTGTNGVSSKKSRILEDEFILPAELGERLAPAQPSRQIGRGDERHNALRR
jgi:hypothetical protein